MARLNHMNKDTSKAGRTGEPSGTKSVSRDPAHPLLQLQQTLGNRVVNRLIQAKLTIGRQGDVYEQEADRVADQVMRMPTGEMQPAHADAAPVIRREAAGTETPEVTPPVESEISAMKSGGRPLPESVRSFFEPRFGYDFSQVRVHDDARSAQTARMINARAFTTGQDIVFGAGEYSPETGEGKRLLAHELTHVVQQGQATGGISRSVLHRSGVPGIQRFEATLHEEAERTGLASNPSDGRGFTVEESSSVYFGNWMRDMNQVFVPIARKYLSDNALWHLVSYLAVRHFGREMTPEQFGYYIPAEHLDNPAGLTMRDDLLQSPPTITGSRSTTRPAVLDTLQDSPEPGATVLGAPLFSVDQTGVMAHIRRTNLHIERRLELAAQAGRTPEGMMNFGAALHAMEDLFAHSNWVEIAVGKLLSENPGLLRSRSGSARNVFHYSPEVNLPRAGGGTSSRPVLTTGSFTGQDTIISVGDLVEQFLSSEHWEEEPSTNEEREAQRRFTVAMLRDMESQLRSNSELRIEVRNELNGHIPGFLIDGMMNAPFAEIYEFSQLPIHIPDKVRIPVQRRIRRVISESLRPIAAEVQARGLEARIADTSLIRYLADNQRTAQGVPPQRHLQERQAAQRHVQALLATPDAVVAGPAHSQISKDHTNSPFFDLAFTVAVEAVRRMGEKMIAVWDDQLGTPTQPFNFNWGSWPPPGAARDLYHQTRPMTVEAANASLQRGRLIVRQGGESPTPYSLEAMRHDSAEQLRSAARGLRTVANAPNQAATGLLGLLHIDPRLSQVLTENVQQQIRAAAGTMQRSGQQIDGEMELRLIASELEGYADTVESARTHEQRERAAIHLLETRQRILRAMAAIDLKSGASRKAALNTAERAVPIILFDAAFQSVDVAYSSLQRQVLEGKAGIPGHPRQDLPISTINLPDAARDFSGNARSRPMMELIEQSRILMSHPYENRWWDSVVLAYINANERQILADIEARNEGYSFFRRPR